MKLEIELVPRTSWFTNLRSMMSATQWEHVKKLTFSRANYRCEICSGKGPKHPVECHEIWSYDDQTHVQKLERTIALCPACHRVKHMGLQMKMGRLEPSVRHFMKVNNISRNVAEDHIMKAFKKHEERSKYDWEVDVSWLKKKIPNIKFKER